MNLIKQFPVSLQVWYRHIWQTGWRYIWLLMVPLIISLLQWLLNFRELWEIITGDNNLSLWGKIDVFGDSVGRVFTEAGDWTPISFILIASLQAAAISLLLRLRRAAKSGRKQALKQASSLGIAVIGAGCVACGGSLITPLLGLLFSNLSVGLAQGLGDILLFISVIMSIYALNSVANHPYFKVGK